MELRYRLAELRDGSIEIFIESEEERKKLVAHGAVRFSAHSFSKEPSLYDDFPYFFGDLHFPIELGAGAYFSEILLVAKKLKEISQKYAIPLRFIRLYKKNASIHIVIPERLFQGELGLRYRVEVDKKLWSELFSGMNTFAEWIVHGGIYFQMLPLVKGSFDVFSERNRTDAFSFIASCSEEKAEGLRPCCDSKSDNSPVTPCSLLAYRYMKFPKQLDELRFDKQFSQYTSVLRRCSVLRSGFECWDLLSEAEQALIHVFSYGMIPVGEKKTGLVDWDSNEIRGLSCSCLKKRLKTIESSIDCTGCDQVSSPLAFLWLVEAYGGVQVQADGAYPASAKLINAVPKLPLMGGLWVESKVVKEGKPWGLEICGLDVKREVQCVVISYKDMNTPKLFKFLKQVGLEVPRANIEKGAIRTYLTDYQCPTQSELIEVGGWKESKTCVWPAYFVFPLKIVSHNKQQRAFKTMHYVGVRKRGSERRAAKRIKNVAPWRIVHTIASRIPYLGIILAKMNLNGICFHFYTSNTGLRESFLDCLQYNWQSVFPKVVFSVDEALRNIKEIRRGHNHSFVSVGDVRKKNVASMQLFLEKFFEVKRKKSFGAQLVIISSGECSLAVNSEVETSGNVFVSNGRLCAINIDISSWDEGVLSEGDLDSNMYTQFFQMILEKGIEQLRRAYDDALGECEPYNGIDEHSLAALSYIQLMKAVIKNEELFGAMPDYRVGTEFFDQFFEKLIYNWLVSEKDIFQDALVQLIKGVVDVHFHAEAYKYPVCELEGTKCLFVPVVDLKKWLKGHANYSSFMTWLKGAGHLVECSGSFTQVKYYAPAKKSVRGYFLRTELIHHLLPVYSVKNLITSW